VKDSVTKDHPDFSAKSATSATEATAGS